MDFPIAEHMDEHACHGKLVAVLHPAGLACPRRGAADGPKVHRRHRDPVLDDRCDSRGRVPNAFTGTGFPRAHRRPSEILSILRGIRPPVAGMAGRDPGRLRVRAVERTDRATLEAFVGELARTGAMARTDESPSYAYLDGLGLGHATVCHVAKEWARDDDGDGIREAHDDTPEGIGTGLRDYPRIFRRVSKHHLAQYVAVFLWSSNVEAVTEDFLRVLMDARPLTDRRT